MKNLVRILFLIVLSTSFLACSSMLCTKEKTRQGLFFSFDPYIKKVNLGYYRPVIAPDSPLLQLTEEGANKISRDDPHLKKMFVNENGFLIIHQQITFDCDNMEEVLRGDPVACKGHRFVNTGYHIRQYEEKSGYKEWTSLDLSDRELESINKIQHSFAEKPDFHYENCRFQVFGGFVQFLQIIFSI